MKKSIALLVLIMIVVLGLTSCGSEHVPVAPVFGGDENPTDGPGEARENVHYTSQMNTEEMLSYLDGTWSLCPMGRIPGTDETVTTITFISATREFVLDRDVGEWCFASFQLEYVFGEGSYTLDLMDIEMLYVSKNFSDFPARWENQGNSSQLMFFTGSSGGKDFLVVRNPGNGEGMLDYEGLGYNLIANDRSWVFIRDSKSVSPLPEENDSYLVMNGEFYAFCWFDAENYLGLQQIYGYEHDEDLGFTLPAVGVLYSDTEYGHYAFAYSKTPGKDVSDFKIPDTIRPGLVYVKTNADGSLSSVEELEYAGYGVYWQPIANQAVEDNRNGSALRAEWGSDVSEVFASEKVYTDPGYTGRVVVYLIPDHTVAEVQVLALDFEGMFDSQGRPGYIQTLVYETEEL
ncbi:MAG: hypothetical protein IJ091_03010, partial [Oscillospiraceae bacterium]|nr:hypothetical protein [Oscillospiraceae bacterium]